MQKNGSIPATFNPPSREVVKMKWLQKGLWDEAWKEFPGLKWKHEYTIEELLQRSQGRKVASRPWKKPRKKSAHLSGAAS